MSTEIGDGRDGRDFDQDALLLALAHRRRRRILFHLYVGEDTLTLWDLAVRIATEEFGKDDMDQPACKPSSQKIERVQHSLYHRHVPKLAESQLVRTEDSELVELADLGFRLEPRLRGFVAPGNEAPVPDLSQL